MPRRRRTSPLAALACLAAPRTAPLAAEQVAPTILDQSTNINYHLQGPCLASLFRGKNKYNNVENQTSRAHISVIFACAPTQFLGLKRTCLTEKATRRRKTSLQICRGNSVEFFRNLKLSLEPLHKFPDYLNDPREEHRIRESRSPRCFCERSARAPARRRQEPRCDQSRDRSGGSKPRTPTPLLPAKGPGSPGRQRSGRAKRSGGSWIDAVNALSNALADPNWGKLLPTKKQVAESTSSFHM